MAIGVVQGEKVYKVCYGFASLTEQTPIDTSTIFEIGSISKVFTTEMAEILARKGLIDWKSTIGDSPESPITKKGFLVFVAAILKNRSTTKTIRNVREIMP